MAHMALYRKWRPMTFEEVVEQRHIVTALKNSIKNNAISHAYLFCGTRGTGKTTMAKIFARAINCLEPVDGSPCNQCITCRGILDGSIIDVIEIDAASNNGVDDVREIKEAVMYVPAITRYKVYIIDEVHMLSTGAFNALLKTLEEPPENVVFILATTEPYKLPATILSRCQRFDFKRITMAGLTSRLKLIAEDCGVSFEDSAIQLIARLSKGGMRDAISLLDQCISLGKPSVTRESVVEISGMTSSETIQSFARAIIGKDVQPALNSIKTAIEEGRDLQHFCTQLIDWFRNLMLIKTGGESSELVELDEEELKSVMESGKHVPLDRILDIIKELAETEGRLKWAENQRILLEIAAVKLCMASKNSSVQTAVSGMSGNNGPAGLEARITGLERRLDSLERHKAVPPDVHISAREEAEDIAKPEGMNREAADSDETAKHSEADTNAENPNNNSRMLDRWANVIEHIRGMGKMKVYAYLLDTQCMLEEGKTALVIVSGEDKKTVLGRNDSLEAIKKALFDITGLDLKVKIADDGMLKKLNPGHDNDPTLEKIKQFAEENAIPLDIRD